MNIKNILPQEILINIFSFLFVIQNYNHIKMLIKVIITSKFSNAIIDRIIDKYNIIYYAHMYISEKNKEIQKMLPKKMISNIKNRLELNKLANESLLDEVDIVEEYEDEIKTKLILGDLLWFWEATEEINENKIENIFNENMIHNKNIYYYLGFFIWIKKLFDDNKINVFIDSVVDNHIMIENIKNIMANAIKVIKEQCEYDIIKIYPEFYKNITIIINKINDLCFMKHKHSQVYCKKFYENHLKYRKRRNCCNYRDVSSRTEFKKLLDSYF